MAIEVNSLFIVPEGMATEDICRAFWPEVQFKLTDSVHSFSDALEKLVEARYSVCFVDDRVTDGLDLFFKDISKLDNAKTCSFVQLAQAAPSDDGLSMLLARGFAAGCSRSMSPQDCRVVKEILQLEWHQQEIIRRTKDVAEVVKLLTKELDAIAKERLRGKERKMLPVFREFLLSHAQFDQEIFEDYIRHLIAETGQSEAFEATTISVPAEILNKKLPNLTKDKYSGASLRVWDKLLKKFGESNDAMPSGAAESSDPRDQAQSEAQLPQDQAGVETAES